jgi:ABC-type uncharacterized transport system permease subunit
MSGITIFCFGASYFVALVLEITGLWKRFGWHRVAMIGMALAGLIAHSSYLVVHATGDIATLGTPADWYLVVAWVLAAMYVGGLFAMPKSSVGLFALPLVVVLVAVAASSSQEPFAPRRGSVFWGGLHGWLLALGAVSVSIGFLAGVMYLVQSWRLKRKLPPSRGFRLPSLEVLEQVNGTALGFSVILVAGGVIAGVILSRFRAAGAADDSLWTDPLVWTSSLLLMWLVVAEVFRWIYPAARRGQKVAYLTLASFGFLVLTLVAMRWTGGIHDAAPAAESRSQTQQPSISGGLL